MTKQFLQNFFNILKRDNWGDIDPWWFSPDSEADDAKALHDAVKEAFEKCGTEDNSNIGKGWIAVVAEGVDEGEIQWCITTKEFWEKNHYLNDGDDIPTIPNFMEIMESTYEYCGKQDLNEEQQAGLLRSYGFEIMPVSDWAE